MGLDEFMDIEPAEESKSNKDSSNTQEDSKLEDLDNYRKTEQGYKKYGPYGYESVSEYNDTVSGTIEEHGDMFKYNLPIFPHIEGEQIGKSETHWSKSAKRFRMKNSRKAVSVVSCEDIPLGEIPREIIMLDTGEVEKDQCIDVLEDRFDYRPSPSSIVSLYFIANVRHLVKMAMGDAKVEEWSLKSKDHIIKAVFGESYTQKFRRDKTVDGDMKSVDHIEPW